jgi:SAM-dependent methyltransferase
MNGVDTITECRSCGAVDLEEVLDLGTTPLADRLLRADQLAEPELTAPLTLSRCSRCTLVQIIETVDPEILFFEEYPYFSSVSASLSAHFEASATEIIERRSLTAGDLVVEAASNDGYLLRHFQRAGIDVVGIDPATAPAQAAIDAGIPTIVDFFGIDLATDLRRERGPAAVFLANNVLAHVPDLNGFVAGIATVLADDGVAVIEAPYLVDLLEHGEFDTIYHQHLCYFSVGSLTRLFDRHGLSLTRVERTTVHGGSLRLRVERDGPVDSSVADLLELETERGLRDGTALRAFGERVNALRRELRELLDELTAAGARIAGYGAAAKATTLLAYCGVGRDHLDYVCDLNEYKHGRFMGGSHLPIVAPSRLTEDPPDYVLILAWNFAEEIMRQNAAYERAGGRFIVPVPNPAVVAPTDRQPVV